MSECVCEQCVRSCERNPGWMTPEEASAAMDAGHAQRLMRDWLEPSRELGNEDRIYVLAPAAEGCEAGDAPEVDFTSIFSAMNWCKGKCTFLSSDKRCEIHDSGFKPTQCKEGKACDETEPFLDNYAMARLWGNEEARGVVERWKNEILTVTAIST